MPLYTPLPEGSVRLLRLLPRSDEHSRIECQLIACSLLNSGSNHPYEALSYRWGPEKDQKPVYVNNCELSVRANLHAALSHLQDRFIERIIWIDAICINQEDNDEKGHQVQSMAKIYAKASRVIVWLGQAAGGSDQALEVIRKAAEDQHRECAIDKFNQQAVLTLLKREWFQRIWVLQEVAAARHVLIKCGPTEIDGYAFCSGLNALNLSYKTSPNLQGIIPPIAHLITGAVFRPPYERYEPNRPGRFSLNIRPLSELVDMYHARKATDPLDKVYALLGMSSDDPNVMGLSVNYETSWKDVFLKLVKFSLSDQMSVSTWDGMEVAVIEGKGCILGEVSSIRKDSTRHDRQHVDITWKNAPSYFDTKGKQSSHFTFQASAKPIQADEKAMRIMDDLLIDDKAALIEAKYKEYGQTPLSWAAERGHEAVVRLLLDKGAAVDREDKEDWTPLLWAAVRAHEAVVQLLLDKGAAVDKEDKKGRTPLLWAAGRAHEAVVQLLLDKGAAVDKEDKKGRTPLSWAAERGHEAVVRLLLDKGAAVDREDNEDWTPLLWAAERGHEAVVRLLLDKGAAVGEGSEKVLTPRFWAAVGGHKAVERLLELHAVR
ncbi:hypothetical protein DL771_004370 [Monosporascus sp. 5C6A]|nr:hypothetical protein DL771_004370 [Monosporascus sp. 5C6A]